MLSGFNLGRAGAALSFALLTLVPVAGQAAEITASVPFSFAIGEQTLPAGDYRVSTGLTTSGIIFIHGLTGHAVAMASARSDSGDVEPKLVFHKYGDDYFLRQVWTGSGSAHELFQSRAERNRKEGRRGSAAVPAERVVVPGL